MASGPQVEFTSKSNSENHSHLLDIAIRGASQLRKKLKWDYNSYNFIHPANVNDAKGYYLYGVLNEIEKAGMSMMQAADWVSNSSKESAISPRDDDGFRIEYNILQSKIDELTLWQRKMTEILIDLIGFRGANIPDYYKHYLTQHELASLRRTQADTKEFYNSENANYTYQERELISQLDELTKNLDPDKCWYVKVEKGKITRRDETFENKFKSIFPKTTAPQKALLRTYHSSFGRQSKSIHPTRRASNKKNLTLSNVDAHIHMTGLLTLHVIVAVKDLMRIHNTNGFLKMCAELVKKNPFPIELHRKATRPDIHIGDFVIVSDDLAQVTRVVRSKYGYRSFGIKYLSTPPIPTIIEDTFIGELVHLYIKNKDMAEQVKAIVLNESPNAHPTTYQINRAVRKSVIDMWNHGGKEIAFRRPDGYKKMRNFLESQKTIDPTKD